MRGESSIVFIVLNLSVCQECFCKSPRNAFRNVGFRLYSIDSLKTAILSAKYFKSFKQGSWISSLRTFAWSPRVLERREARFREGAVKGGLFWTMKAAFIMDDEKRNKVYRRIVTF